MSSCQISGLPAMKSPSNATQSGSSTEYDPAAGARPPRRGRPRSSRASPITTVPMPNWRRSPLQYQHGDKRGDHDAVGELGAAARRPGRRPSRHAWRDPRPARAGCARARAASRHGGRPRPPSGCRPRTCRGGPRPGRPRASRGPSVSPSGAAGDICSGGRVMSTAADRTYTTTVGSQQLGVPPLVAAFRRADDRRPSITVDLGVAFAETAGLELAELMRPARSRDHRVRRHHGHSSGHRGEPGAGGGRLRDPAQDTQNPPGRVVGRARLLHHDGHAAAPAHGSGVGRCRARSAVWPSSTTSSPRVPRSTPRCASSAAWTPSPSSSGPS